MECAITESLVLNTGLEPITGYTLVRLLGLDRLPPAEQALRDRALNMELARIKEQLAEVAAADRLATKPVSEAIEDYDRRIAAVKANRHLITEALTEDDLVAVGLRIMANREGELALRLNTLHMNGYMRPGTLARMPLSGGTPREVTENVQDADWSGDGEKMAIVRLVPETSHWRLEYPVGKVLYDDSYALFFHPLGVIALLRQRAGVALDQRHRSPAYAHYNTGAAGPALD